MNWDTVQQIIRIAMQVVGGMLMSAGYLDEANVATLTGAVISLGGVLWWALWEKKKVAQGDHD